MKKSQKPLLRANFTLNHISCLACGATNNCKLGAGKTPGGASLHCGNCKKFIRWLSPQEARQFSQPSQLGIPGLGGAK